MRSLESIQSLSVMTQWIHNFKSFWELLDKELIRESFEKKWEEIASLDLKKAKSIVLAWCGPMPETLLYLYENTDINRL